MRAWIRSNFPEVYAFLKAVRNPQDGETLRRFVETGTVGSLEERKAISERISRVHTYVQCAHTQSEILEIISAILRLPPTARGAVLEAGTFHGGSAAKLSIACKLRDRKLLVYDSFQGLPEHDEQHERTIFGTKARFRRGDWAGTMPIVVSNIEKYGEIDVCGFRQGWYNETLPSLNEPIAIVFMDVDLASSTRTCLKYIYPLLSPGGSVYSHDGHLPLVIDVMADKRFWEEEVNSLQPVVHGLGTSKLIRISKPENQRNTQ